MRAAAGGKSERRTVAAGGGRSKQKGGKRGKILWLSALGVQFWPRSFYVEFVLGVWPSHQSFAGYIRVAVTF
jgi:hypothetical protein